jgi:hypothetical protein
MIHSHRIAKQFIRRAFRLFVPDISALSCQVMSSHVISCQVMSFHVKPWRTHTRTPCPCIPAQACAQKNCFFLRSIVHPPFSCLLSQGNIHTCLVIPTSSHRDFTVLSCPCSNSLQERVGTRTWISVPTRTLQHQTRLVGGCGCGRGCRRCDRRCDDVACAHARVRVRVRACACVLARSRVRR